MSSAPKTAPRTRYHHGDLRNALTVAALELAREGGPEALVLREAARRVGVSATAAYRHFAGQRDLLIEVKNLALTALAEALTAALDECDPDAEPGDLAVARLRSAAHAYLNFAFTEPGLFNTAFCHDDPADPGFSDEDLNYAGVEAFVVLGRLLDELVAAGRMSPQRRPNAEFASWATVHGVAVLFLNGPLRHLAEAERAAAIERAIDVHIRGLICDEAIE